MTTTAKSKTGPVRVLVIDDSPTARELMVSILQVSEGVQVVGVGTTGEDAVRLTRRMKPDVLLMDISMPRVDGLEATRQIMYAAPTPIVLVTGTFMHSDIDLSFAALNAGALTVLSKPGLADVEACEQLVRTVKSMAQVPVVRRWSAGDKSKPTAITPEVAPRATRGAPAGAETPGPDWDFGLKGAELQRRSIIGIAASTGGPGALAHLFRPLPADFPLPILLVQHVTPGFATGFAEWLDGETALQVRVAAHGEDPRPGTVLVAPDDYHLQVSFKGGVELYKAPPYRGLRPSANYLFQTLARAYGPRAIGIILTGMGDDGAEGLEAMHQNGALTLAQDKDSCVVYGMPQEAVLRRAVDVVLSLDDIARALARLVKTPNDG